MFTHKLYDTSECEVVRWLFESASKDESRPILQGIYITDDGEKAVACDGFTLAVSDCPVSLQDYAGKVIRPVTSRGKTKVVPKTPTILEWEEIEGTYPDYTQIVPHNPKFRIAFDPKFISRIANVPGGKAVVCDFSSGTEPVKMTTNGDGIQTFVCMPMSIGDDAEDEARRLKELNLEPIEPVSGDVTELIQERDRLSKLFDQVVEERNKLAEDKLKLEGMAEAMSVEIAELRNEINLQAIPVEIPEPVKAEVAADPEPEPEVDWGEVELETVEIDWGEVELETVEIEPDQPDTAEERQTFEPKDDGKREVKPLDLSNIEF